nr:hypothetical protein CFP56_66023 [Quercus suber]
MSTMVGISLGALKNLVKGHEEIHEFIEHLVDEPLELPVEEFEPLDVRQPGVELEGVNAQALEFDGHVDNEYRDDFSNFGGHASDDYRPNFSQNGGHDNEVDANHGEPNEVHADHGEPIVVDAKQVYARRPGKEPVAEDQQQDPVDKQREESSETEGNDLEDEPQMQPMNIGEDSTDSWDNETDKVEFELGQMGAGIMNSDYESKELLSLDESSFDSDHCDASSDDDNLAADEVGSSIRRSRFPIFKLVAKAEHIRFEKDMLFISPKQFKKVITDYAVHGGKASKAREKAQDVVDEAYTAQFNQLWEYYEELRRCSLRSIVLMKVHTVNDGGNSSLPGNANQVGRITSKATKKGNANNPTAGPPTSNAEPTIHSAPPTSNANVFTSAPQPSIDIQPNPRQKRQKRRRAITSKILNAIRNVAIYMEAMRLSGVHDTTSTGLSEQKHVVGPLFFKLPPVDTELDSMNSDHEDEV